MPEYDFYRDMAELDARMRRASDFASTLMGMAYDQAHSTARSRGYDLVKVDRDPVKPISADLQPRRIRCWVGEGHVIVETQVG